MLEFKAEDPSTWPKMISSSMKNHLIELGPTRRAHTPNEYPAREGHRFNPQFLKVVRKTARNTSGTGYSTVRRQTQFTVFAVAFLDQNKLRLAGLTMAAPRVGTLIFLIPAERSKIMKEAEVISKPLAIGN